MKIFTSTINQLFLSFIALSIGYSQSLSFDGSNDYATAPSIELRNSVFTIEVWYKSDGVGSTAETNIVNNYGTGNSSSTSWNLFIKGSDETGPGKVRFNTTTNGSIETSVRVDDNQWHHIAVVRYSDGALKIFIDGQLNVSGTVPMNHNINSGQDLLIGSRHYNRFTDCKISQLMISESAIYSSNFTPSYIFQTDSNALIHYKFNEGTGTTLTDRSGNGNNGTIVNGATWVSDNPDATAPTISSVSLDADNTTIAVTMSEAVFNTNSGSGALQVSDFALSISGGTATLASATPSSISISGNVYTLGINLSGIANGSETITVVPAANNAIYDAAGNAASTSQSNNTASLSATGKSLSFDGSNDYVSIADADELDGMANLTVQFYVKWDAYPYQTNNKGVHLVEKWQTANANATGSYSFYTHHDADNLTFMVKTQNAQTGVNIALSSNMDLDKWYLLTGVYDGSKVYIYIDGTKKAEANITGTIASTTYPLEFANQNNNNTKFFDGSIDEVALWDDALSAAEITALYNSGTALDVKSNSGNYTSSTNLKGYWKMEEGTGTSITDLSGNGNNGTINGAAWATGRKSSSYNNTPIDVIPPTITSVSSSTNNGSYKADDVIAITITFSENVTVSGTPHLTLETGSNDAVVNYSSGSGGSVLTFNYTVASGHISSDLDYKATNSLALNSGTIRDAAGNNATLTLASPGQANSLSANKALVIDTTPPTVSSVSIASNNATIAVTMSEAVYNTNGGSGVLEAADFSLSKSGGLATLSSSTPSSISISGNVYTLGISLSGYPPSGAEIITVVPVDNGIYDAVGNEASTTQSNNTVLLNDKLYPYIASTSLAADNSYIDATYSEPAYSNNNRTGAIDTSDATIIFAQNGGNATNAIFSSFTQQDNTSESSASALQAGATSARAFLKITGIPSGVETISWKSRDNASFFDSLGNADPGTAQATPIVLNDQLAPTMTITATDGSNAVSDGATTNDGTLTVTFTSSEATTNFAASDITVSGGAISNFAATSSTVYTATFTPSSAGATTIDVAANTFTDAASNNNTVASQFNWTYDSVAPTITGVSLAADNSTLAVTMSEAVYNTNGGSGALEVADFAFSISGGAATLSSATPSSISSSGNVYTLGIGLSGTPNGSETLTVVPTDNGIYDTAGNEASTSQSNNTASLSDKFVPAKPSGLKATAGVEKVAFIWNKNSENDVASYKVYRSTTSGFSPSSNNLIASVISTYNPVSWSDNNLQGGTTYYYRISAVDQAGNESLMSDEVNATVMYANLAPSIQDIANLIILEDRDTTITIVSNDPNGDVLTFTVLSDNESVKATHGGNTQENNSTKSIIILDPDPNWNGSATISATVKDSEYTRTSAFSLTVTAVNDTPLVNPIDNYTTDEEVAKSITVTATDIDGDALAISASVASDQVVPSVDGMELTLTPAKDYAGSTDVSTVVSDGTLTDTAKFIFNVLNVNDAPVITAIDNYSAKEDSDPKSITLEAKDIDDESLVYTAYSDTSGITINVLDNTLTYTLTTDYFGKAEIAAVATDPSKAADTTTFTLTVDNVQDAPKAFEWVTDLADTIIVTQDNISSDYAFEWTESKDVDNEVVDYLLYAKIGPNPFEIIYDTISTTLPISYEEFATSAFEQFPMLPRITVAFKLEATDGIDTVAATGDNRIIYINRIDFLSTADLGVIPKEFALHNNYPNPFNPSTQIRFDIPQMGDATLIIYNMLGQKIREYQMHSIPAGYHSITWDATNDFGDPVSAGVYLYQLQTKGFIKTKKMVLLK
tara:strand:- start:491 stop:5827 length:5337 start_codon:yes stop_codon:yes gene_type:complete